MGYQELLKTLATEVERQSREVLEEADRECARIRAEGAAAGHQLAQKELDQLRTGGVVAAAREEAEGEAERALFVEKRALLGELRREAEAHLPSLLTPTLGDRLLEEVAAELSEGSARLKVHPSLAPAVARGAARRGLKVPVDPDPAVMGLLALIGERRVDDTLPTRLENAFRELEPALSRLLFQEEP